MEIKKMTYEDVAKLLSDNHLYGEINQPLYDKAGMAEWVYDITIDWGDWKHEHLFLANLMEERGYHHTQENIIEEDGSDCYSARHRFVWEAPYKMFNK